VYTSCALLYLTQVDAEHYSKRNPGLNFLAYAKC